MNYYKRHLGDYAKNAAHLSLIEHGVFTLLLDRYYTTEKPLTRDDALRVCRARSPEEIEAVNYILQSFFCDSPSGHKNSRADAEIEQYRRKSAINREIGLKGGRPKTVSVIPDNPEETQTVSETKPKRNPSHKPLAINHKQDIKGSLSLTCANELVIEGMDEALASEWIAYRKHKKAALTPRAWKHICEQAKQARMSPSEAVSMAMARGWRGFEAEWVSRPGKNPLAVPKISDEEYHAPL